MVRFSWRLIVIAACACTAVGAAYFWFHKRFNDTVRYADAVRAALERGDRHEADRLMNTLMQAGGEEQVHCLRGELALREARALEERLVVVNKWEQAERALRILSDSGGMFCQPAAMGREPRLLASCYLAHVGDDTPARRQNRDLSEQIRTTLREAMRQYQEIRHDERLIVQASAESGECMVRLKELGVTVPVQEAVTRLRFAVDRQPNNAQIRRWLAALYLDMKAPNSAIAELQKVAELDPTDGRPHRVIGVILKDYRQYELARAAYQESLRRHLEPHVVAEVIGELAELLLETGRPTESLETLNRCPAPFRDTPYLQGIRAQCLWELGNTDDAVALADKAMCTDPTLLPMLRLRASILLAQEKPQAALPLLLRYVRIDPINNQSRKMLADTYRLLGEREKADEQTKIRDRLFDFNQQLIRLTTELMLKPQDDGLRVRIGQLWLGIDQLLEARNWFRSALEVNPANAAAKRSLDEIERLAAR